MRHCEIFADKGLRRGMRYTCVFLLLLAALCVIAILNINIGSVHISVSQIAQILFTGEGDATQVAIVWRIRLPRMLMAAILGRRAVACGISFADVFRKPHRRTVRAGHLFGREDGRGAGDDLLSGTLQRGFLLGAGHCGVSGVAFVHGVCAAPVPVLQKHVRAAGGRHHDRIFVLRRDGFYRQLCRGERHR